MDGRTGDRAVEAGRAMVDAARDAGFAAAGVCAAEPTRWGDALRAWLDAGKHGSMGYLAEHLDVRLDPAELLDGARGVLMVADLYASRADNVDGPLESGHGRIARYARGADYHKIIKKRLHKLCDALAERWPEARFRAFVDTAQVLEREFAARCGMGWTGKHTLLIHPKLGSYTLLGGVVTTMELAPPDEQESVADHCGTCTRCIDACPTDAITPYSVDARRCISYLTIERREAIDERYFGAIGEWLYGCDICQQVCPHNSERDAAWLGEVGTTVPEAYTPRRDAFDLLDVLGWDEDARREAFTGSAMKRATLAMMKRNAVIVAGNALASAENSALHARIEAIALDEAEDEMVRQTARRVLDRLAR